MTLAERLWVVQPQRNTEASLWHCSSSICLVPGAGYIDRIRPVNRVQTRLGDRARM